MGCGCTAALASAAPSGEFLACATCSGVGVTAAGTGSGARVAHAWPGAIWLASTSAMWRVLRPVKCSICCRQEIPATAIVASSPAALTAGKRRSSPIARDTS